MDRRTCPKASNIKTLYNNAWDHLLTSGKEDFGDIECDTSFIQKTGLVQKHHSIIEFGCGFGKFCNWLFENGYTDVTGIDISETAIDYGKKKYPQLKLICTESNSLSASEESFDICLSFDFIEHLHDVSSHLAKAWGLLKPGGKYLIQTPNIITNAIYSTILARGFTWIDSHPSLQSRRSLKNKLHSAGFSKVEFYTLSPVSDFKLGQLLPVLRWIFARLPWERMPWFLQIGISVVAWK